MGCEYANFSVEKHFKGVTDEKEILRSLKEWELEARLVATQSHFKSKYEFVPLETHQALVYLGMRQGSEDAGKIKPEKELQLPNSVSISDDEGTSIQLQIEQCFGETMRFYDRNDVQEIILSEESVTPQPSPNKQQNEPEQMQFQKPKVSEGEALMKQIITECCLQDCDL